VAIVKLSALGDVVHALPLAAAIRAQHARVRLTWIVERRHAPVLRGHPALDDVVSIDTRGWRSARSVAAVRIALGDMVALRRRLREARFDVAVDAQGLLKSGVMAWLTGAPVRIGFAPGWSRERVSAYLVNRHVTPPASAQHVVEQYLSLLQPLGVEPPSKPTFDLPSNEAAERAIDEFLAAAALRTRDRLVVVNPGAGRPQKRWAPSRFAALARVLMRERAARVVVLWGPGEQELVRTIARDAPAVVVAPPTDVDGLLAVLRRADLVIAGDTGPLHLAAGLGVPCVGLFGPTSARRNGPWGDAHRCVESADRTMAGIEVHRVVAAVDEVWS
jgi:lipopolysaccharide heptosyltransferase I